MCNRVLKYFLDLSSAPHYDFLVYKFLLIRSYDLDIIFVLERIIEDLEIRNLEYSTPVIFGETRLALTWSIRLPVSIQLWWCVHLLVISPDRFLNHSK